MILLITGGSGFIGSNLIHYWLERHPEDEVVNFDALTYAGNPENLKRVESDPRYHFFHGDLRKPEQVASVFEVYKVEGVIHLAAESHVDRSIQGPACFLETNITGTFHLLETARHHWRKDLSAHRFHHVSTDEVYGSLEKTGYFSEKTAYSPNSPYSSSKAASDHLVRAWTHTYGMNTVTTNCSNNYGPYQFPEKLIPLTISNCLRKEPVPVYGDGRQVRDWLFVEDHCEAIDAVFQHGDPGETYNVGGRNEWANLDLVRYLCKCLDRKLELDEESSTTDLITHVQDRPGHDRRYAIDASKIEEKLGWRPRHSIEKGLEKTLSWYLENREWVEHVTSGTYREFHQRQYGKS